MSSQALARRLGVTFQQVQKYEKGKNRIAAAMLCEIGSVLGHDVAWFIEGIDGGHDGQRGSMADDVTKLAVQVDRLPEDQRPLVIKIIQACLDACHGLEAEPVPLA